MTSRDFVYWLQGFFEISEAIGWQGMTEEQCGIVKKHLALVFTHEIDPSMGDQKHQDKLNDIHGNPPGNPTVYRC